MRTIMPVSSRSIRAILVMSAIGTLFSAGAGCTRRWESGLGTGVAGGSSGGTAQVNSFGAPGAGPLLLIASSPGNGWTGVSTQTGFLLTFNQSLGPLLTAQSAFQTTSGPCDARMPVQIRQFDINTGQFICLGIPANTVHINGPTLLVDPQVGTSATSVHLNSCTQYVINLSKDNLPLLQDSRVVYFSTGSCTTSINPGPNPSPLPSQSTVPSSNPFPTSSPSSSPTPTSTPTSGWTPSSSSCSAGNLTATRANELIVTGNPNGNWMYLRVVDTFPRNGQSQVFFGAKRAMRPSPIDTSQDVFFYVVLSDAPVNTVTVPIQKNARAVAENPVPGDSDFVANDQLDHSYSYGKYAQCDAMAMIHLYKTSDPSRCVGVNKTGAEPHHMQWITPKLFRFDVPYLEPSTSYTMRVRKQGMGRSTPASEDTVVTFTTAPADDALLRPLVTMPLALPAFEDIANPTSPAVGTPKLFSSFPQKADRQSVEQKDRVSFLDLQVAASFRGALPDSPGTFIQSSTGTCQSGAIVSVTETATGVCFGGTDVTAFNTSRGGVPAERLFGQVSLRIPFLNPNSDYTIKIYDSIFTFKTANRQCCADPNQNWPNCVNPPAISGH